MEGEQIDSRILYCSVCGANYDLGVPRWRCDCEGYLKLDYSPVFDRKRIMAGPPTLWRYREALPLAADTEALSLGEGLTPLLPLKGSWGKALFKCDYLMPTGSYKDRGSAVMLSQLKAWGIREIIEDSSGNAGASVAAYCRLAGIDAHVYIPDYTSEGKAAQIAMYRAELHRIPGPREATTRAAEEIASAGTFYASHNWSPWFTHGVKTLAFEIWEQLGWKVPHALVVPSGQGSLVLGLYDGFKELMDAGEITFLPRIFGVQTTACAPLAEAFAAGETVPRIIEKGESMAEGIASAFPLKGREVLEAVRVSGGGIITVSEVEIWQALKELAGCGVYVEPTSGTAPAALIKLRQAGIITDQERVVVELTGFGLKATDKIVELSRKMT